MGRLGNRSVRTPTREVSTLPPPSHALRNQTVGHRAKSQGVTLVAKEAPKGLGENCPKAFCEQPEPLAADAEDETLLIKSTPSSRTTDLTDSSQKRCPDPSTGQAPHHGADIAKP